jgi:hypothetical protein
MIRRIFSRQDGQQIKRWSALRSVAAHGQAAGYKLSVILLFAQLRAENVLLRSHLTIDQHQFHKTGIPIDQSFQSEVFHLGPVNSLEILIECVGIDDELIGPVALADLAGLHVEPIRLSSARLPFRSESRRLCQISSADGSSEHTPGRTVQVERV